MKLYSIEGENIKIDGGATFGVVPKAIWEKYVKADEKNLIDVSLRSLLIKDAERLVLVDTGLGRKQSQKFYDFLYVSGWDNFLESFKKAGYEFKDVTDVILTHLHYDHCGGALRINEHGKSVPVFENAKYWCSKKQWERAKNPFLIEKPSYFEENYQPLMEMGLLNLIEEEGNFSENISLKIMNGHTSGQLVPIVKYGEKEVAFMADFIPSSAHINLTYITAFDYEPLISLKEKEEFLKEAVENEYVLMFQHDNKTECCTVMNETKNGKKIYRIKNAFRLSDI